MNSLIFKLIAVCFVVLSLGANPDQKAVAQRDAGKPLRVLVDASKCGGLWWFPQGAGAFDPAQPHQGKALADFMRYKGWQVTELPRGEVITFDKLRDADIVIRPPSFFDYTLPEVDAYHQAVMAGTRLLLIGSSTTNDIVAQIFGVRFEPFTRFASVRRWIPHPFTENIDSANVAWTPISEVPPGATVLAWLNQTETSSRPALGFLPYGKGYIVFMSQPLIAPGPAGSFSSSLINSVARFTPEEIRQLPIASRRFGRESKGIAPALLEPVAGATLPQPATAEWRFDWDDVPGAKTYEIVVLGPSAMFPMLHTSTTNSEYVAPIKQGYIWEKNLEGWSWRVRALYGGASSGPWSPTRRFNVVARVRP